MSDDQRTVPVRVATDERYPTLFVDSPPPQSPLAPDVEIPAALFHKFKRCEEALEEAEAEVAAWILENAPDISPGVRSDCKDFANEEVTP